MLQFNSESNNQDLMSDISFWLGADSNNFKTNDRVRSCNEWQNTVWSWIFEAYGGWKFMPADQSDTTTGLPYADQNVSSGTGLYGLPEGTIAVDAVELKTSSAGSFDPLTPLTYEEFMDMGGDGAFPSTGTPWAYILQGDVIRLLPTPNFTLASALRVFFGGKAFTAFTPSSTTATPGFEPTFHRIISIGAALDFAQGRLPKKVNTLQPLAADYEKRIKAFYAKRFKARFPNRVSYGEDLVDEFS